LGLAIDRFDPKKFKTKFSTYAVPWIKLKIFDMLGEFENMVYVPQNVAYKSRQYKKIMAEEHAKDLSDKDLTKMLETTERGFRNIKAVNSSVLSLESPCINDSDNETTLQEVLPDTKHVPVINGLEKEEIKEIIKIALNGLDPIQKEILIARYLTGEKNKLVKLGKKYRLSGERIRQIEYKALKKLRGRLKDKSYFNL
jgi:RNA polymerase sigma factor (sigma-70 family)